MRINGIRSRLASLRFSRLDFKVGVRMLSRYPGITVVGTLAIAVAIALGSVYFEAINKWRNPRLPIPGADRVVSIRNWDARAAAPEPQSLHDFAAWREQVHTVDDLGAAVVFLRNLETADGRVEPVRGAEISAAGFSLMGTRPLLGRVLTAQDELPGEPPVVVLGHTVWKARFASDPAVIGRTVKLGTSMVTIVGVMPEGFGFPTAERIWAPLRIDGATLAPRTGPAVSIFGRLAPGASLRSAQAELSGIGARIAAANPETHRNLAPRVTSYAKPIRDGQQAQLIRTMMYVVNGIFLALLTIVCMNVATLVFARTATRGWEITVRNALGASRGRIITQLFVEALVLTTVAALLGLVIAKFAIGWALQLLAGSEGLPFWIDDGISWRTALKTGGLALFGAAIVGVLPALRATRIKLQDALRTQGSGAGLRFGGFWTTVIVIQVALTVALLPLAAAGVFESNRFMQRAEGIGAQHYLTARIDMDREDHALAPAAFNARARLSFDELERRLAAEPGVEHVTFADRLPVMDQFKYRFEVDSLQGGAPQTTLRTSTLVQVSRGFFDAFGTSVIAGRDFAPVDYETRSVVLVNESFARHVFAGRNAIGQRIRIVAGEDSRMAGETWYEIVGVVRDFGWQLPLPHEQSAIYQPRLPLPGFDASLAVRVRDPEAFAPRLRKLAADIDPTIRLTDVQPLTTVGGGEAKINWALTSVAWLVAFVVLLLSATGIHALMSFTVARRTREIGVRAALGARPGRIVAGVFTRAFLQISAGIVAGSALAALLGLQSPREVMILLAADALMLLTGLAACAVPLRRALRIDPTEALRAEV